MAFTRDAEWLYSVWGLGLQGLGWALLLPGKVGSLGSSAKFGAEPFNAQDPYHSQDSGPLPLRGWPVGTLSSLSRNDSKTCQATL